MSTIKKIIAREILDSRGNPTVEVKVVLSSGIEANAAVPSGASTGTYEALELRDGDEKRYGGLGVKKAVEHVNTEISETLFGHDANNQIGIDRMLCSLDGTENKSRLGANAILGVSLAACRAAAKENDKPLYAYINSLMGKLEKKSLTKMSLPIPMFNVLNGGQHSDSGLSIQEFKIVPAGVFGIDEQIRAGSEVFHALKKLLAADGFSTGVGDEGGFAPRMESNTQALEYIKKAVEAAGYLFGKQMFIGLDAAANSFFDEQENKYILKPENVMLERERLIAIYREWMEKYAVISIEDGLAENDWDGWAAMLDKFKKYRLSGVKSTIMKEVMVIGDDLLVTNVKRLQQAIEHKSCNSVLIKVNQIGTLTETLECILLARKHKMKSVISHRSGETTDDFISDLAVGAGAEFMKSGSLSRSERLCKYNRLMEIASELA